jgi:hypothetical protein
MVHEIQLFAANGVVCSDYRYGRASQRSTNAASRDECRRLLAGDSRGLITPPL